MDELHLKGSTGARALLYFSVTAALSGFFSSSSCFLPIILLSLSPSVAPRVPQQVMAAKCHSSWKNDSYSLCWLTFCVKGPSAHERYRYSYNNDIALKIASTQVDGGVPLTTADDQWDHFQSDFMNGFIHWQPIEIHKCTCNMPEDITEGLIIWVENNILNCWVNGTFDSQIQYVPSECRRVNTQINPAWPHSFISITLRARDIVYTS